MIYHATQSDDYLLYLILRGKKTKTHPNTKFLPIFNGRNNGSVPNIIVGRDIKKP